MGIPHGPCFFICFLLDGKTAFPAARQRNYYYYNYYFIDDALINILEYAFSVPYSVRALGTEADRHD